MASAFFSTLTAYVALKGAEVLDAPVSFESVFWSTVVALVFILFRAACLAALVITAFLTALTLVALSWLEAMATP